MYSFEIWEGIFLLHFSLSLNFASESYSREDGKRSSNKSKLGGSWSAGSRCIVGALLDVHCFSSCRSVVSSNIQSFRTVCHSCLIVTLGNFCFELMGYVYAKSDAVCIELRFWDVDLRVEWHILVVFCTANLQNCLGRLIKEGLVAQRSSSCTGAQLGGDWTFSIEFLHGIDPRPNNIWHAIRRCSSCQVSCWVRNGHRLAVILGQIGTLFIFRGEWCTDQKLQSFSSSASPGIGAPQLEGHGLAEQRGTFSSVNDFTDCHGQWGRGNGWAVWSRERRGCHLVICDAHWLRVGVANEASDRQSV